MGKGQKIWKLYSSGNVDQIQYLVPAINNARLKKIDRIRKLYCLYTDIVTYKTSSAFTLLQSNRFNIPIAIPITFRVS